MRTDIEIEFNRMSNAQQLVVKVVPLSSFGFV